MGKIHVGVLYGGRSVEHDISVLSAKNIIQHIDRTKFDVSLLGIDKQGKWFLVEDICTPIDSGSPLSMVLDAGEPYLFSETGELQLDVVFPVLHGTDGEDGAVQGLLQTLSIAYVGSGVLGSAASMDKVLAKRVLLSAGLPVAKFKAYYHHQQSDINFKEMANQLGLPFIIKPANLGSSVGVAKIIAEEGFANALTEAFRYDQQILIEEFIDGREVECAILGNDHPIASVAGEIVLSDKYEFYSFTAKYEDPEAANITIPAELTESVHDTIKKLSLKAFQLLNCHDLSRVDLFVQQNGRVLINEINTLPGFTNISMYPSLIQNEGITYQELITKLISMAFDRYKRDMRLTTNFESRL